MHCFIFIFPYWNWHFYTTRISVDTFEFPESKLFLKCRKQWLAFIIHLTLWLEPCLTEIWYTEQTQGHLSDAVCNAGRLLISFDLKTVIPTEVSASERLAAGRCPPSSDLGQWLWIHCGLSFVDLNGCPRIVKETSWKKETEMHFCAFCEAHLHKTSGSNDVSAFPAFGCLLKTELKVYIKQTTNKIPLGSSVVGLYLQNFYSLIGL